MINMIENNPNRSYYILTNDILKSFDFKYINDIINSLSKYSSTSQGFRLAGSEAEHKAAEFIRDEMDKLGLNSYIEKEDVDVWIYNKSNVRVNTLFKTNLEAISFPGIISKSKEVSGELVFGGYGTKHDLDNINIKNKIVLIDLRFKYICNLDILVREAQFRGAKALILTYLTPGEVSSTRDDVLFTMDSQYYEDAIPSVFIRRRDALELLRHILINEKILVTVELKSHTEKGEGYNVIGELEGDEDRLIVLGAHHDAHFYGALDNASGVATLLYIAKSLIESGYKPKHKLLFISFTAEEYGVLNSLFDYLIGSYRWIERHKDLHDKIDLYVNVDVVGYNGGPILIRSTPDISDFTMNYLDDIFNSEMIQTYLQYTVRPSNWLDMWNFVRVGVPSIHFGEGNQDYHLTYYHTEKDIYTLISENKIRDVIIAIASYLIKYDNANKPSRLISLLTYTLNTLDKYRDFKLTPLQKLNTKLRETLSKLYLYEEEFKESSLKKKLLEKTYIMNGCYPTDDIIKLFFEEYCSEISKLEKIHEYIINNKDIKNVLNELRNINYMKWAKNISPEIFEKIFKRSVEPENWGLDKTHKYNKEIYQTYRILASNNPDIKEAEKLISSIINERKETLDKLVDEYIRHLNNQL